MDNNFSSRIIELDDISFSRNITKHTAFLTASEQSDIIALSGKLSHPERFFDGGYSDAERKIMICPADYDDPEKISKSLISCIKVSPLSKKYSDELSHRDFLGALMNLGIERSQIGDIVVRENEAYIFCMAPMTQTILDELTKVKHTSVNAVKQELAEADITREYRDVSVNVASERIDAVISAVWKMSRSSAAELISAEKVFADGRIITSAGDKLKENARVSVRGYGKFIYSGIEKESRKGRLFVNVRIAK